MLELCLSLCRCFYSLQISALEEEKHDTMSFFENIIQHTSPTTIGIIFVSVVIALKSMNVSKNVFLFVFISVATCMVIVSRVQYDKQQLNTVSTTRKQLFNILDSYTSSPIVKEYVLQYPGLVNSILIIESNYAWIDPPETKRIFKIIVDFVELFAIALASTSVSVGKDSIGELKDMRRDILNGLASYYVKETSILNDNIYAAIVAQIQYTLSKMLKTLANKHNITGHLIGPIDWDNTDPHLLFP